MQDIRLRESVPELRTWQQAGWPREPRNGYECRLLRDGKPCPVPKEWRKPFRCRKRRHLVNPPWKTQIVNGKETRFCVSCKNDSRVRYYQKNKTRVESKKAEWLNKIRSGEVKFEEGYATVPSTWVRENVTQLASLVKEGRFIVEVYGELAYAIVPITDLSSVLPC